MYSVSLTFLLIPVLVVSTEYSRKLVTIILCSSENHNCSGKSSSFNNVIYTEAVGVNDTLHYIYSSVGYPSVLVILTRPNAKLIFNATRFLSANESDVAGSVSFSDTPLAAYSILFTKVIEYSDLSDDADMTRVSTNDSSLWNTFQLLNTSWDNSANHSDIDRHLVQLRHTQGEGVPVQLGGSLTFQFQTFSTDSYSSDVPHVPLNTNLTHVTVLLDRLLSESDDSRFALESVFLTSRNFTNETSITEERSIDDEHTPGIFDTFNWVTGGLHDLMDAYIQWRPVCYTKEDRSIATLRKVRSYPLQTNVTLNDHLWHSARLAYAYFGDDRDGVYATAHNVSYGMPKDKFYASSNYTVWTFSLGYGRPPATHVSLLIILAIVIGLGLPVAFLVFGGLCVLIKRKQRRQGYSEIRAEYEEIN